MAILTGQVVDNSHVPVENATITIPAEGRFALTNEKGMFEIQNIPEGIITIYVIHRHYQNYETEIHLNSDLDVMLTLAHE
jgi:hypothetical protein